MQYPEPIAKLIDSYMKLPGIGQKTATRLAFYTIDMKDEVVALQHKIPSDLDEYKRRLKVLEGLENPNDECKQNIKALKKSIVYTERTNKQLVKLI